MSGDQVKLAPMDHSAGQAIDESHYTYRKNGVAGSDAKDITDKCLACIIMHIFFFSTANN